ncbi:Uncharacterised protein [Shewanella baltica]|nr:Uncharacterised protein [Shewanella baltica]
MAAALLKIYASLKKKFILKSKPKQELTVPPTQKIRKISMGTSLNFVALMALPCAKSQETLLVSFTQKVILKVDGTVNFTFSFNVLISAN